MRFLILFFVFFLCLKAGFDDDEMSVMNEFGANMMTFYFSHKALSDRDRARVGCYIVFCHFDDKNSCINNKKVACNCDKNCINFADLYTKQNHYIRKDSYTLWKETSECENDCSLLLSKKEGSDNICAELCGFHFSYSNKEREAYEKEIKELFHTFLKNARFRLV